MDWPRLGPPPRRGLPPWGVAVSGVAGDLDEQVPADGAQVVRLHLEADHQAPHSGSSVSTVAVKWISTIPPSSMVCDTTPNSSWPSVE